MDANPLIKRARKKYLSARLASELVELRSTLHVGYRNTLACCHQVEVGADQVLRSTFFCRRRWCSTCASINMATLIDRYRPAVEAMPEPMFVTLTMPNCRSAEIETTLDRMTKTWREIADVARKARRPFDGIRKLELKVGKGGGFHPHYHVIMNDATTARWLIDQWLERWPTAARDAQHLSKVKTVDNALVELMKYATKLTCSEDAGNLVLATARQMDRIFRAVHGRRLVQPFGKVHRVPEDAFDPTPQMVEAARGLYTWIERDWFHVDTGEALTNYDPQKDAEEWKRLKEDMKAKKAARRAARTRKAAKSPETRQK